MALFFDDFKSIVLNETPLIDVRAPVEFKKGAFLNSHNFEIMNDEERHVVGICYKNHGNAKAIELGHELVSGDIKEQRVGAWCDFIDANPDALLYCFRGGQRSKISQEWLHQHGREIKRLKGGYKAFRAFLLKNLEESHNYFTPIVVGGRTGCGKTELLMELPNAIDLEALANHRGSSFGKKITPQPSQIDFENALAYKLIQKIDSGNRHIVFEDEGKHVGSLFMPESMMPTILNAQLVILDSDMYQRVERTLEEYVIQAQNSYKDCGFVDAFGAWEQNILEAINRIERRLGHQKHGIALALFKNGVNMQLQEGLFSGYKEWIEYLLREYYDPMYDYQIQKRSQRVVFRGKREEVFSFLS